MYSISLYSLFIVHYKKSRFNLHSAYFILFVLLTFSLYTDIAFGNKFGLHTVCVLTGVTNQALIDKVNCSPEDELFRPKYVLQSVTDILNILKE